MIIKRKDKTVIMCYKVDTNIKSKENENGF